VVGTNGVKASRKFDRTAMDFLQIPFFSMESRLSMRDFLTFLANAQNVIEMVEVGADTMTGNWRFPC